MAHDGPPPDDQLSARLLQALRTSPEAGAVGIYDGGGIAWLTRGALLDQAFAIAQGLRRAGLQPGEACVVAPFEAGERDAAVAVVGCILAQCSPLVTPAIDAGGVGRREALALALATTRSPLVLVAARAPAKTEAVAQALRAEKSSIRPLSLVDITSGEHRLNPERRPSRYEKCRVMQLTSGTTGQNRVCMWSGTGLLRCIDGVAASMRLRTGDLFFTWAGLHHTVGISNYLLVGLLHGVPTVFMSAQRFAKQPASWLRGLCESGATITSAANFAFKLAAETISPAELEGISLAKMRAFWNTGERVAASSYDRFHDRFGAFGLAAGALCANYGLAENSGGATFSGVGAAALRYETVDRERLQQTGVAVRVGADEPGRVATIASLGAPWPGLAIEIRDESGHLLPDGATGEIALRSPSRFLGYCNDPGATAAALDRGVLLSGDLGYVRGGQLFWTGRKRECIMVRGRKIDPGEFLPVLEPIEGLRSGAFAAFGVDDERSGTQRVVIVAELQRQDGAKAAIREIRRAALSGLGVAADDVLLVAPNTLVTTISGKRRHSHYKALYLKGELELLRLERG